MGGKVHSINDDETWKYIQEAAKEEDWAVVVDFSAAWCGPCRIISPYFEQLSYEIEGIFYAKIDVDDMEELAEKCGVNAMPTFQVWKNGEKIDELVGADRERLKALVAKHAAS